MARTRHIFLQRVVFGTVGLRPPIAHIAEFALAHVIWQPLILHQIYAAKPRKRIILEAKLLCFAQSLCRPIAITVCFLPEGCA